MVKDEKREQIFVQELPRAKHIPHERLSRAIEFEALKNFLQTLLTVVVFDKNVMAADLLFATHTLDPEK